MGVLDSTNASWLSLILSSWTWISSSAGVVDFINSSTSLVISEGMWTSLKSSNYQYLQYAQYQYVDSLRGTGNRNVQILYT